MDFLELKIYRLSESKNHFYFFKRRTCYFAITA